MEIGNLWPSSSDRQEIRNPEPGNRNPQPEIQNPRLSWVILQVRGAISLTFTPGRLTSFEKLSFCCIIVTSLIPCEENFREISKDLLENILVESKKKWYVIMISA